MPTFKITSPDGAVYRVNGPEGATVEDAIAYVQQNRSTLDKPAEVEEEHSVAQWAAIVVVLLVLALIIRALIRKKPWRSRRVKIALVFTGLWVTAVQIWGFIFHWDDTLSGTESFVLNISVPLLFALAWLGFNWIRRPQQGAD